MAAFLIAYQSANSQSAADLEKMLAGFEAVPLGERVWGLETDWDELELRKWLENQLNAEDFATVMRLRPSLGQISSVISPPAKRWLVQAQGRKVQ